VRPTCHNLSQPGHLPPPGYGLFQGLGALGLLAQHLTVAENVIVQTTAVATATMPLAAGASLLLLLPLLLVLLVLH
jgi:uncharacterized oligopeptide transporter (OPT) family protein